MSVVVKVLLPPSNSPLAHASGEQARPMTKVETLRARETIDGDANTTSCLDPGHSTEANRRSSLVLARAQGLELPLVDAQSVAEQARQQIAERVGFDHSMAAEPDLEQQIDADVQAAVLLEHPRAAGHRGRPGRLRDLSTQRLEVAAGAPEVQVGDRVRTLPDHAKGRLAGDHQHPKIKCSAVERGLDDRPLDLRALVDQVV